MAVGGAAHGVDGASRRAPDWFGDWQHPVHAEVFDGRHALDATNLARNYESFNDVQLLTERVTRSRPLALLEVGCATGEMSRYLRMRFPRMTYAGLDISRPAIARARQKYPDARWVVSEPGRRIADHLEGLGMPARPEIVYTKDVIHHQPDPLGFITELLGVTSEALILRTRTRDVGHTVTDPERSCQYHYDGWMPFIVLNLQELLDHIRGQAPGCEVVVYRHHMILGGRENRFLPKECYLPETGTAETAVGVFLNTAHPGEVTIEDRPEAPSRYTLVYRLRSFGRRVRGALRKGASPQMSLASDRGE